MQPMTPRNATHRFESARASLMMLAFGMGVLAFLIAIERPQWFRLRPVSAASAAMAQAASPPEAQARNARSDPL